MDPGLRSLLRALRWDVLCKLWTRTQTPMGVTDRSCIYYTHILAGWGVIYTSSSFPFM